MTFDEIRDRVAEIIGEALRTNDAEGATRKIMELIISIWRAAF